MSYTTPASIAAFESTAHRVNAYRARRAEVMAVAQTKKDNRVVVFAIVFVLIIAFSCLFAHNAAENARFSYAYDLPRIEVTVQEGDTIDGIAAAHPVEGLSAHELGYVISEINKGEHSIPLMPGDRLMIPNEEQ